MIIAKINGVLEPTIVQALYRASQAGVRIEIICRGICALRPGIPGISETIRVISIVDRFLEHSRVFYFGNGGEHEVYVGSADWMDRNLSRRVEVLFPVEQPNLKQRLISEIIAISLADNVKSRELLPNGTYRAPGARLATSPSCAARSGSWNWLRRTPPAGMLKNRWQFPSLPSHDQRATGGKPSFSAADALLGQWQRLGSIRTGRCQRHRRHSGVGNCSDGALRAGPIA